MIRKWWLLFDDDDDDDDDDADDDGSDDNNDDDDDKEVVACGCGSLFPLKGGSGTIKQGEQASSRGEILHKYKCKYKYCANKLKNQIVVKNVRIIADGL